MRSWESKLEAFHDQRADSQGRMDQEARMTGFDEESVNSWNADLQAQFAKPITAKLGSNLWSLL